MKKLLIALICGIMLVPVAVWGQTWIEPHTTPGGAFIPGHWQTPEDLRQEGYTTPGRVNPYTGKFDPYSTGVRRPQPISPPSPPVTPYQPNYQPNFQPTYKIPGSALGGGK